MEHKIIRISSKRQITIPQDYFEKLGFIDKAECVFQNGGILIRPIRKGENEPVEAECIVKQCSDRIIFGKEHKHEL